MKLSSKDFKRSLAKQVAYSSQGESFGIEEFCKSFAKQMAHSSQSESFSESVKI